MLEYLKKEEYTHTENGALTHITTGSDCLDLFASIGALRQAKESEILKRFQRAYAENPDMAMKILFFARDIRGGLGERRIFRVILTELSRTEPQSVLRNIPYIAEYGRFDDLLTLLNTPCEKAALEQIRYQLASDLQYMESGEGKLSLLAKWLPSVNASSAQTVQNAKKIARYLHMNDAAYRKTLARLRKKIAIIENYLRERDYTFSYEKQPSRAMYKYRKAFIRNDKIRYVEFINRVQKGEAKLNTGTLYPYELIAPVFERGLSSEERASLDASWNSLPDYTTDENALVVVDGSGSMYWSVTPDPASVAISLGLYFAERNKGRFHNHFITFSEHPKLVQIKGKDLVERVKYVMGFNEVANTNVQAVFDLILHTAVKNHLPQEELPKTLYFVSDMEFDRCASGASKTNFQLAKENYEKFGYQLPQIIFWNVASRNQQQPVTKNERGVALVSGCSPRLFSMVSSGRLSPYQYMMEILQSSRYQKILA